MGMKLEERDLERFLSDVPGSDDYRELCNYVLRGFVGRELDEGEVKRYAKRRYKKKSSSYNLCLALFKTFANWKMKRLDQSDLRQYVRDRAALELIQDIKRERVVVRLERKELSEGELRTIFGSLGGVGFSGLWSLAWFGIRPGELVGLSLKDINKKPDKYLPPNLAKSLRPGEHCVKFLTKKTVVERAVFMDGFTKGHLERFIRSGFGYGFLYKTCAELQGEAGAEFTPKWFRSTFQTKMQRRLLEAGVPMVKLDLLVKVMSGHTVGQDITSVYTDYGSDIKRAMTELHYLKPLEKELGG